MRRAAYLALLWAVTTLAHRAEAQTTDFLRPADSYFSSYSYANEYYPKVRAALTKGLPDTPVARLVVLPASAPEYVVSVDEQTGRYYLTYCVATQRLWSLIPNDSARQAATTAHQVEVTPVFAKALGELFNAALFQTRYPAPSMRQTTAGESVTYIFNTFQFGRGAKSGKTSSPAPGTKLSELISLAVRLPAIATAPNGEQLQAELLGPIQALTLRFSTP